MGNSVPCVSKDKDADEQVQDLISNNAKLRKEVADLRLRTTSRTTFGDSGAEGAVWLNTILAQLWPRISEFVKNMVKDTVEPLIQAALPGPMQKSFYFEKVSLGETPLSFGSITAAPQDYFGRNGNTRDIVLKLDVIYLGDAHVGLSALGTPIGIQNIQMHGVLTIVLKELLDQPPFISGISVFFANSPRITMDWSGAAGVLGLGALKHTVRDIVRDQVNNICVLPKRIAVVLDTSEPRLFRIKAPRPGGCVHLRLVAAKNLEGKDWNLTSKATSDPYAQVRVGAQMHRSKTIKKTCDPKWDEELTFYVFDEEQEISVDLFDEDFGSGDDFLGRAEGSVKQLLERCDGKPTWLKLQPDVDGERDEKRKDAALGEVQVLATWMPITLDQAKANAIKAAGSKPQCLLFMGLYSVKVPPEVVGTKYTVEASCNGKAFSVTKALVAPTKDAAETPSAETKAKIDKLRSLKADDLDIAMILGIPVEALKEKDPTAKKYADEVMFEEPFLWFAGVPKDTVVNIAVSKGKVKIGNLQYTASRLLEIKNCTKREFLEDGQIKCEVLGQVRVIEAVEAAQQRHG